MPRRATTTRTEPQFSNDDHTYDGLDRKLETVRKLVDMEWDAFSPTIIDKKTGFEKLVDDECGIRICRLA